MIGAKNPKVAFCSGDVQISSFKSKKTRKVVEHLCLFKAKENLSEEQEKDMLDYLYTSQYQMGGIVAISVVDAMEIFIKVKLIYWLMHEWSMVTFSKSSLSSI